MAVTVKVPVTLAGIIFTKENRKSDDSELYEVFQRSQCKMGSDFYLPPSLHTHTKSTVEIFMLTYCDD